MGIQACRYYTHIMYNDKTSATDAATVCCWWCLGLLHEMFCCCCCFWWWLYHVLMKLRERERTTIVTVNRTKKKNIRRKLVLLRNATRIEDSKKTTTMKILQFWDDFFEGMRRYIYVCVASVISECMRMYALTTEHLFWWARWHTGSLTEVLSFHIVELQVLENGVIKCKAIIK